VYGVPTRQARSPVMSSFLARLAPRQWLEKPRRDPCDDRDQPRGGRGEDKRRARCRVYSPGAQCASHCAWAWHLSPWSHKNANGRIQSGPIAPA